MTATNEDGTNVWIDVIQKKLQESIHNKKPDLVIAYGDVSKAFPAGPHSNYFELKAIDFHALKAWATEKRWDVKTAPEITHADQQTIPWIRFTKK